MLQVQIQTQGRGPGSGQGRGRYKLHGRPKRGPSGLLTTPCL